MSTQGQTEARRLWLKALQEMQAEVLVVLDESGCLIDKVGTRPDLNAETLSSLAAASLMALHEIRRLAQIGQSDHHELVLLEGPLGKVFIGKGRQGLVFLAVLPPDSFLGMARLIFKQLLDRHWDVVLPSVDELSSSPFPGEQALPNDLDDLEGLDLDAIWSNGSA